MRVLEVKKSRQKNDSNNFLDLTGIPVPIPVPARDTDPVPLPTPGHNLHFFHFVRVKN